MYPRCFVLFATRIRDEFRQRIPIIRTNPIIPLTNELSLAKAFSYLRKNRENHSLNVIRQNLDSSIQSQTLKNTWFDNANSLIVR